MAGFDMKDYVPVNERIDQFYRAHPEGSIQSEIVELTTSRVTVKAYAYRQPEDPRPGIGHSSLEIPGSTPYTKGSEIENCETSAWGRAIAALGFEVKRGIASHEEIRNKQSERPAGGSPSSPKQAAPASQYRRGELAALMKEHGLDVTAVEAIADRLDITERPMSDESMDRLIALIEQPSSGVPTAPADGEAGAETPASPTDSTPAASPPASSESALTIEDVLAVSGGEEIPPAPGTDAFKALDSKGKLAARVWHQEHPAEAVA